MLRAKFYGLTCKVNDDICVARFGVYGLPQLICKGKLSKLQVVWPAITQNAWGAVHYPCQNRGPTSYEQVTRGGGKTFGFGRNCCKTFPDKVSSTIFQILSH